MTKIEQTNWINLKLITLKMATPKKKNAHTVAVVQECRKMNATRISNAKEKSNENKTKKWHAIPIWINEHTFIAANSNYFFFLGWKNEAAYLKTLAINQLANHLEISARNNSFAHKSFWNATLKIDRKIIAEYKN